MEIKQNQSTKPVQRK